MNPILEKNLFLFKEHVGMFKHLTIMTFMILIQKKSFSIAEKKI